MSFTQIAYAYLYFNYAHSAEEVIILSEYSSLLTVLVFMIATLIAIASIERKPCI